MAKDPAVLFYTSDFLSETVLMNDEEIGQYIKLLCIQHQKGSLTKKDLEKVCTSMSEDVLGKFTQMPDGTYANVRLDEEIVRRKSYSESRRNNRKKKDEDTVNNPNKKEKYVDDTENICLSCDEHMETVTEARTDTIAGTEIKEEGDDLKKATYAEFVTMTNDEHSSLVKKFGKYQVDEMVDVLNNYKGASGKKYKSDYRAILSWVVDKVQSKQHAKNLDPRFMGMLDGVDVNKF